MPFIRVKSAVKTDPQHEFDVSEAEYEANRALYTRVEKGTSDEARPVTYVEPVKHAAAATRPRILSGRTP